MVEPKLVGALKGSAGEWQRRLCSDDNGVRLVP